MIEAIRDDSGQIIGFAKITRDITERRDAQIALEQTREQLAQAQKLEAIGQLTGGIAHDFNNLLMIVSGHAQILRRRISDAKAVQAVDAIHAAANRGESLTRQLLAFSRRQQLSPVVVDLAQHLDAMLDMLRSSLRGNIEFVVDLPSGIWLVEVDVAEFELALVNVAVNARDAMPNGGKFTLSVRNLRLAPNQDGGKLDGDFVAVVMSDTGTGVPPEIKTKIFDPFFTTKPVGKGTGLGLSQVYGFAQQSGGAVHVDSEVGRGTTVTLYLPRKYAALPSQAEAPGVQAERHNEGTILLVEDDAEVAKTTALLLEQLGYQVIWEENAANALKRLDMTESVALILSDIVMPGGMDGVALAREIRSRFPHIPVLLTSGYSDAVRAAEHQFAILRKPFQISALDKAVRETLEQHGPVAA
jgi:nitrogen-specific signal transduction histidine kinase/CheY-like chemotaxis protein